MTFFYRKTTGKFLESPSCGASYPGFLRTSHPDGLSSGEFVKGTVCFAQNGGCYKMQTIKIMKCQGFWIYELPRPAIKRARYCGNKGIARDEFFRGRFLNQKVKTLTFSLVVLLVAYWTSQHTGYILYFIVRNEVLRQQQQQQQMITEVFILHLV